MSEAALLALTNARRCSNVSLSAGKIITNRCILSSVIVVLSERCVASLHSLVNFTWHVQILPGRGTCRVVQDIRVLNSTISGFR